MRVVIIGALCALVAVSPARAEACRGQRGDMHLVRAVPDSRPLFLAMSWNGRPEATRAVSMRCLRSGDGGPGNGRPGRRKR
jgi:hypothetical protein